MPQNGNKSTKIRDKPCGFVLFCQDQSALSSQVIKTEGKEAFDSDFRIKLALTEENGSETIQVHGQRV